MIKQQKTAAMASAPHEKATVGVRDWHFTPPGFKPVTIAAKDIHEATAQWEKIKQPL